MSIAKFKPLLNVGKPTSEQKKSYMMLFPMDYLTHDTLKARGSNCIADLLPKLMNKALVDNGEPTCDKDGQQEKSLMICYPKMS